jgi:outer membrane protein TolC
MLKKLLFCLFFHAAFGSLSAQENGKMSMKEAINYAVKNNQELHIAQLNIEDAKQQIIQTRATGLPQINLESTFNRYLKIPVSVLPNAFEELIRIGNGGELPPGFSNQVSFALKNNFQAGINLRTMVFDGSFFTGLKAAELYRNLLQDQFDAKQQEVENQVIEAFLPSIIIVENSKVLDKNMANVEKLLNETKALYKEGFVEQLDVDRLELTLWNLQTEKESLDRQKETVMNSLKMVMNYPIEKELIIAEIEDWNNLFPPIATEDLNGGINYSKRLNYKALERNVQLNDLNIDYTKQTYLPTVHLNASYTQAYQGNKLFNDPNSFWAPTGIVGLSLKMPIFDGFGKRAKIEKAKLASEISRKQQSQLSRLIDMEINNARIQYHNAKKRLDNRKRNLELAERIYNTTQIKYKEGVGSSLEINQAEQSLFDSQRNHTQALYELLSAQFSLNKALGTRY